MLKPLKMVQSSSHFRAEGIVNGLLFATEVTLCFCLEKCWHKIVLFSVVLAQLFCFIVKFQAHHNCLPPTARLFLSVFNWCFPEDTLYLSFMRSLYFPRHHHHHSILNYRKHHHHSTIP